MKKYVSLALAGFLLAGCPKHAPKIAAPETAAVRTRDVYVLLLILDGGRTDTVYQAVDGGLLPNFKRWVFDRGVRVKDAVAVFPSVTTSGHQAFITGLLPGHSGITGLDWFDRASGRVTDYLSFDVLGIDEDLLNKDNPSHPGQLFAEPDNLIGDLEDGTVATVYEPFHMGITDFQPRFPGFGFIYHFVRNQNQDLTKDAANDIKAIYERPTEQIPRFVMATFLGHDVAEHHFGPGSKEHLAEMKLEDHELGQIVERMKRAGIWDKTYIVVAADHGQHPTGKYVSIPKILRNAGLRPRGYYAAQVNTYSSLIAITSANIYLNKGEWSDVVTLDDLRSFPTTGGKRIDLVDALITNDAVEFALVPEPPDRVHILAGGNRHGVVTRRSFNGVDYLSYATPGGAGDPLRYTEQTAVAPWVNDGHFHAADEWALATRDSLYPDAPLQLTQLFDGDRAGDLVVTAKPGWHFKPREYVSSHGGLGRDDMRVPLVISGPGMTGGTEIPFARTADVYPTLRRVFGLPVNTARMDGRPLDEILPWVPESARVEARHAPNREAKGYFSDLAALEAFLDVDDTSGALARDPAVLFDELKRMDTVSFGQKLDQEVRRDATLRREVAVMRDSLISQVRVLDSTVKNEGRDDYNDKVHTERRDLKKNRERSYILGRTLDRLDARLARSARLKSVLDLVRIAHDVDELRRLYAAARTGAVPQ